MALPALSYPPVLTYTREEYLALDAAAPEGKKYEFDGVNVWAMAGAAPEHNQIKHNVEFALAKRLEQTCRIMSSDQRVRLEEKYVYPDIVAFCEEGRYTDERPASLLNPTLIVEVLSPFTQEKDLSWKADAYISVASLQECWFLWTDEVRVKQYVREGQDEWRMLSHREKDATLRCRALDIEVPVEELYEFVL